MDPDSGTSMATISPGDKFVAALGTEADPGVEKGPVRVFDLATQKSLLPQPIQVSGVVNIAVDDNGHLFAATRFEEVMEYQVSSGETVAEIAKAHNRPIETIAVSPDSKVLATMGDDNL